MTPSSVMNDKTMSFLMSVVCLLARDALSDYGMVQKSSVARMKIPALSANSLIHRLLVEKGESSRGEQWRAEDVVVG